MTALPYPEFATEDAYRARFTAVTFWQPYAREVCLRHGIAAHDLQPGMWGTNPVYMAGASGKRVFIKLFTALFGGRTSAPMELEVYRVLAHAPDIPAPHLLATGELFPDHPDWPWPYLILSAIPGLSLGEVRDRVSWVDVLATARALGPIVRRMHALPISSPALHASRQAFLPFLCAQRETCVAQHRTRQSLPPHLVDQLDDYLPDLAHIANLLDKSGLCVGHNDLNQDHVLGEFDAAARWRMTGIIDFGDAGVCDRLYDLTVIHCGLFLGDKRLLAAFLEAYGVDKDLRDQFVYRAMCYTLLHRFHLLEHLDSASTDITSLAAMADKLWRV